MARADQEPSDVDLAGRRLSPWEMALRATGARLCYGEPVKANGRTVIPVASVEAAGGGGWGRSNVGLEKPEEAEEAPEKGGGGGREGTGGGLGGWVSATPVGFIEISSEGTRFRRIIEPVSLARGLAGAAVKGVVVLTRRRKRR
jgi:uncharacterized spore protein YtfJ